MGTLAVENGGPPDFTHGASPESVAFSCLCTISPNHILVCTISDHIYRPEELTPEERQLGFRDMIGLALDVAVQMG